MAGLRDVSAPAMVAYIRDSMKWRTGAEFGAKRSTHGVLERSGDQSFADGVSIGERVLGTAARSGVLDVRDGKSAKNVSDGKQPRSEKRGMTNKRAPARTDRWFDVELNRLYDDVVNEPLPADLLGLVEKLKTKMPGK